MTGAAPGGDARGGAGADARANAGADAGAGAGKAARVAIVGAGAVGCYYGGVLARAGVPVVLIGRPQHVDAMRRDGLRIATASFDEHVPVEASTQAAAVAGAALVLVCVKSPDTEATGRDLAPHLAPGARVLSLQNGVDNAARLQAVLGRPVAPAVVYVATEMGGPGHVRHMGRGELVIPSDIGGAASTEGVDAIDVAKAAAALDATPAPVPRAHAGLASADIVALFARAGVPVELSGNVAGALWGKLLLNCGYNAISAITDMPYGRMVTLPGIARTVHDAVAECLAVAAALDVTIPGDVWAAVDRIAASMPGQVSSTCQDLRRGKPTEIDHLNGYIVRQGDRLGIPVPLNRALHALVKAMEARAAA
ncbi:MAG: 2-dehydropantoate 2-reductase [Burkholderiales bacterium]|nr:2-dehydropantoate 2-reductase [Burkholderiales bacterium]